MFKHTKKLQYHAKPTQPDPLLAKKMQEILGGQYGEMSVMLQYLFQGWNTRGNERYKDMIMDTGTEEIGHVEMIATMITELLDDATVDEQEQAYNSDPTIAAIMGGMNPQHALVTGLGANPKDSNGIPWSGNYIIGSGNLLADMRANINAESQGRLQVARLYQMTEDAGVHDMLKFLLARDTMHQLQWLHAAQEIQKTTGQLVPHNVPTEWEITDVNTILYNFSHGEESKDLFEGQFTPDGRQFKYEKNPKASGEAPHLKKAPKNMFGVEELNN